MFLFDSPSKRISQEASEGVVEWSSPSNIAIVKYWGKYGRQFPRNPSISFTLDKARTTTKIRYKRKSIDSKGIILNLLFEGNKNEKFEEKLKRFFVSILDIMPFLDQLEFDIESSNSFPHSAGIASSASAMSAIACCLCSIESKLFLNNEALDFNRVSFLARLGSGSACRSVFPYMAVWGELIKDEVQNDFSNAYAVEYKDEIADVFSTYHDSILIVSKKEKSVSSTAGHQLMESNVYAEARYQQANDRLVSLFKALKEGDQAAFGKIAEDEALTLHALMMSSDPSYLLIHPNTLVVIEKVRSYREKSGNHLYFTLDAGPNVHLLYPDNQSKDIQAFIDTELRKYCEDGLIIEDKVGIGAVRIK